MDQYPLNLQISEDRSEATIFEEGVCEANPGLDQYIYSVAIAIGLTYSTRMKVKQFH